MNLRLIDLKESNEFLNTVFENINSALFIVDGELRIQQFNTVLSRLFRKSREEILGEMCGNALGCAFAVEENSPCGSTSQCGHCAIRHAILDALPQRAVMHRGRIAREFYIDGARVLKYLEFSTKVIQFEDRDMILVIVDDRTESELQKRALIEKQQRIDEDLKAAAGIQESLLPQRLPDVDNLEIAWRFIPSEMIGGDIFSVFGLDERHIGGYMLDVSGHGVPAALVAVSISQSLRPSLPATEIVPPSEICKTLDGEFPFDRFGTFFTMVYFVLDYREGVLTYANAGHPPMILMHRDGSLELLDRGGTIIGLEVSEPFEEGRVDLQPGDRIFLYTDGIIEHRSDSGEFFGQERLLGLLSARRDRPLDRVVSDVIEALASYGPGKIADDVSLLALEYKGKEFRKDTGS